MSLIPFIFSIIRLIPTIKSIFRKPKPKTKIIIILIPFPDGKTNLNDRQE